MVQSKNSSGKILRQSIAVLFQICISAVQCDGIEVEQIPLANQSPVNQVTVSPPGDGETQEQALARYPRIPPAPDAQVPGITVIPVLQDGNYVFTITKENETGGEQLQLAEYGETEERQFFKWNDNKTISCGTKENYILIAEQSSAASPIRCNHRDKYKIDENKKLNPLFEWKLSDNKICADHKPYNLQNVGGGVVENISYNEFCMHIFDGTITAGADVKLAYFKETGSMYQEFSMNSKIAANLTADFFYRINAQGQLALTDEKDGDYFSQEDDKHIISNDRDQVLTAEGSSKDAKITLTARDSESNLQKWIRNDNGTMCLESIQTQCLGGKLGEGELVVLFENLPQEKKLILLAQGTSMDTDSSEAELHLWRPNRKLKDNIRNGNVKNCNHDGSTVAGSCRECNIGYFLSKDEICQKLPHACIVGDPANEQCRFCDSEHFLRNNFTCEPLGEYCETGNAQNGGCATCHPNYQPHANDGNKCKELPAHCSQYDDSKPELCVSEGCKTGHYFNEDRLCSKLPPACKSANPDGKCNLCDDDQYLNNNDECLPLGTCSDAKKDGTCNECKSGYYLTTDNKCESLHETCAGADPNGNCNSCKISKAYTEGRECVPNRQNCKVDSASRCKELEHPEIHYINLSGNVVDRPEGCSDEIMAEEGTCEKCGDKYWLDVNGSCRPKENYMNVCHSITLAGSCEKCITESSGEWTYVPQVVGEISVCARQLKGCERNEPIQNVSDYNDTNCEECEDDNFLPNSGICTKKLDDYCALHPVDLEHPNGDPDKCLECVEGYGKNSKGICVRVPENCKTEDNDQNCATCLDGFFKKNNKKDCSQCENTVEKDCKTWVQDTCKCQSCNTENWIPTNEGVCSEPIAHCNDQSPGDNRITCNLCNKNYELQNNACTQCTVEHCESYQENTCTCAECETDYINKGLGGSCVRKIYGCGPNGYIDNGQKCTCPGNKIFGDVGCLACKADKYCITQNTEPKSFPWAQPPQFIIPPTLDDMKSIKTGEKLIIATKPNSVMTEQDFKGFIDENNLPGFEFLKIDENIDDSNFRLTYRRIDQPLLNEYTCGCTEPEDGFSWNESEGKTVATNCSEQKEDGSCKTCSGGYKLSLTGTCRQCLDHHILQTQGWTLPGGEIKSGCTTSQEAAKQLAIHFQSQKTGDEKNEWFFAYDETDAANCPDSTAQWHSRESSHTKRWYLKKFSDEPGETGIKSDSYLFFLGEMVAKGVDSTTEDVIAIRGWDMPADSDEDNQVDISNQKAAKSAQQLTDGQIIAINTNEDHYWQKNIVDSIKSPIKNPKRALYIRGTEIYPNVKNCSEVNPYTCKCSSCEETFEPSIHFDTCQSTDPPKDAGHHALVARTRNKLGAGGLSRNMYLNGSDLAEDDTKLVLKNTPLLWYTQPVNREPKRKFYQGNFRDFAGLTVSQILALPQKYVGSDSASNPIQVNDKTNAQKFTYNPEGRFYLESSVPTGEIRILGAQIARDIEEIKMQYDLEEDTSNRNGQQFDLYQAYSTVDGLWISNEPIGEALKEEFSTWLEYWHEYLNATLKTTNM